MNLSVIAICSFLVLIGVVSGQDDTVGFDVENVVSCLTDKGSYIKLALCLGCLARESTALSYVAGTNSPEATCEVEGHELCALVRECTMCHGCFSVIDDAYFKSEATTNDDIFNCVCPDGCRGQAGSIFFGFKEC